MEPAEKTIEQVEKTNYKFAKNKKKYFKGQIYSKNDQYYRNAKE